MKEISIEELAYLIKDAKENKQPQPIFFLGAGASASGDIPLANEIVQDILEKYKDNPFVKKLSEEERSYAKLMECLQPHQRNKLLKGYIDKAKINVTHIYLAQLLKEGYVDYILTVNFDNLMLRALALYNEFPPTHDMAILKDLTTTKFGEKSVVYLHGQHHGLWLLNTEDEMNKVGKTLPRIFDSIKDKRPWVFIGYSGSDPVFDHIKGLGRFDNGLYWVGYRDSSPGEEVNEFLNTPNTNASFIKGYDADSFMLKLNDKLGLEQPEILDKPFSSLGNMLNEIKDVNDEDHFKGVKERLAMSKKDVARAIQQFENKEEVEVDDNERQVDKLKKEIINLLISETYYEQQIEIIELEAKKVDDESTNELLSWLLFGFGNSLGDLAESRSGEEQEGLYKASIVKYKEALTINPDFPDALHNLGNRLSDLAKHRSGKEQEDLLRESISKYEEALGINPDFHEVLYNWGIVLDDLAKNHSGKEQVRLFRESISKYEEALKIKEGDYESLYSWGNRLGDLAKHSSGKEQEDLLRESISKYKEVLNIKVDDHESLNSWGNRLGVLAKNSSGKEQEDLLRESISKYEEALAIKPDFHEALYNLGSILGDLAENSSGKEQEDLFRESISKYKEALKIKEDDHEALCSLGSILGNLAKNSSGKEQEELYQEAIEKNKKAIEHGGSSYNLACIYALRGDKENAFKYLEVSLSGQEIELDFVEKDEDWREYREAPDFMELLSKYKK